MLKVNYGCGEYKLEGFVNVDIEESTKPDLIVDIRKGPFPWESRSVDVFHALHVIEHIELKYWNGFFSEITRVMKVGGELVLAYPEFEVCAKYYIENFRGMRDFWRATLYGRQLYPGDYHITPVTTSEVIKLLRPFGFTDIKFVSEDPLADYHTFLSAKFTGAVKDKITLTNEAIYGTNFNHKSSKKFQLKSDVNV